MIIDLCSGGTLKKWIVNRYEESVSKTPVYMAPSKYLVASCLWQILDAIRYLHERGFVHRDVKHLNSIGSAGTRMSSLGSPRCGVQNFVCPLETGSKG